MIAHVMSLHPRVLALHEPIPHLATEGYQKWVGKKGHDYFAYRLHHLRGKNLHQVDVNGLVYFESSLYMAHFIEELHDLYGARFVHLYRDGRYFTRSALNKGWYGKRTVEDRAKAVLRRRLHVGVGNWWFDTRLAPPSSLESRLEKCAWLWREVNGIILRSMEKLDASAQMSIPLESFDRQTIARLHDFIGVPVRDEVIDEMERTAVGKPNKSKVETHRMPSGWTDTQNQQFERIAGAMMERLGYG